MESSSPDRVKLNTDAALLVDTGEAWGGAVARDHKGHVFLSVERRLPFCSSVEEAEVAAAEMGLRKFAKYFHGNLILETDCAGLARDLKGKSIPPPWCRL